MAQYSRPWPYPTGDGSGAAPDGSYTADEWDDVWWSMICAQSPDKGVFAEDGNELLVEPTAPASNQVQVNTGTAIVNGKFYENDALIATFPAAGFPVVTGAGRERYDRVVLEADWTAQEIRVARVAGVEAATGAGVVPALTQNEGVLFQVPLAVIYIDEAAGVTIDAADIADDRHLISTRPRGFDAIVAERGGDYETITAALAAGHLSIFVRAGTIEEPGNVTLPSGTKLVGESREDTIIDLGANRIIINSVEHVVVQDLTIETTHGTSSIDIDGSLDCTIERIYCGANGQDITADGTSERIVVRDCQLEDGPGIELQSSDSKIVQCQVEGGGGIRNSGEGSYTAGNVIRDSARAGAALEASGAIVGNHLEDLSTGGILATPGQSMVNGNQIITATGDGISTNIQYSTIVGNIVQDTDNGIAVTGADVVIGDNTIAACDGIGITLGAVADRSVIKGNSVRNCGGDGIDIPANCDHVIVSANNVQGNTGSGIDYAADRCIVTSNIALGNGAPQIDNAGATNQVEANNITA